MQWLGMETEYNSYALGLTNRRADWLVNWLRETVRTGPGDVSRARPIGICCDCPALQKAFPGSAIRTVLSYIGKAWAYGDPVMLRVFMGWLADRLEGGDRLQKPDTEVQGAICLVFYTDAKAENGRFP